MVRMQNWEQISFQNACMLNVTLKVTNTGSWITLLITERTACKDNQDFTLNGKTYKQKTTRGWQLCIEWKDKSTSWERLSDMKESYPIEVAEYAEARGISDEPACSWWTTHVLKKRENHSSSQQEIPQDDTRIWDQGAQNCGGSLGFGQREWE